MQRGRRKRVTGVGVAIILALAAAACGGDDSATPAATTAEGASETTAADTGATETTAGDATESPETTAAPSDSGGSTGRPTSIEEWEELWATERAAVVKNITDNNWGVSEDGTTLNGPAGFSIDLSACAAGWNDDEGVSDDTIKIGFPTALSGLAADTGLVWKSADVMFKYYGDKGFFKDSEGKTRTVDFVVRDSEYVAAKTIPLVDELLDSEKTFAIWTFGTPDTLKVYDKINERCVPNPFTIGGSPAWGDPINHPWSTGSYLAYTTEAQLWLSFIEDRVDELSADDGKVSVAGIVANSDFGLTYENAFKLLLESSPAKDKVDFFVERFEITAPTVTAPMTTIASKNPEVFITMTGGAQCTQIINEAANNGLSENTPYRFMSSVCKSTGFVGKEKVGGDGSQADGWWIVGSGYTDPISAESMADDAYAAWARQVFEDNDVDISKSSTYSQGLWQGWLWIQTLIIAGELPGGLTRTNFMLAQRAFAGTSPVHLEGITVAMNGNDDSYFLEGSDVSIWDSEDQIWVVEEIIDTNGKTPNCTWNTDTNGCD